MIIESRASSNPKGCCNEEILKHAHSCALVPYRRGRNMEEIHIESTIPNAYTNALFKQFE